MRNYTFLLVLTGIFFQRNTISAQADWLALPNPTNIISVCPGGSAIGSLLVADFGTNGAPTDVVFSSSSTDIIAIGIPPLSAPNGNFAVINFFVSALPSASGTYTVTATLSHSGGMNPTALLFTVNVQGPINTTITNASGTNILCPSASVGLVANAAGGTPSSYRWYKNGVFTGMTGILFTATTVGSYTVSAINACNVEGPQSAPVVLTAGETTQIVSESCIKLPGGDYQNSVTLMGTNLSYQWRRNGVNISNGGDFSIVNTTNSTQLTVTNVSNHDGAIFTCIITGACGSAFSAGCLVLPVEMVSFTGAWKDDQVLLEWVTASEENNEGFEVQRSMNGVNFTPIGFVKGAGTTFERQQYNFSDSAAMTLPGGVVYYRLRQVDWDGSSNFTDIVTVILPGNDILEMTTWISRPEGFELSLRSGRARKVRLTLVDIFGRVLNAASFDIPAGDFTLPLPITQRLPAGIYYLHLTDGKIQRTWPLPR